MVDNLRMLQCKTSVSTPRHAPRRHRAQRVIVAGLCSMAMLTACGQKGPLIAPQPAAPASAPAAK
jgi:Prokaryotic lipoprotein-attachment site